MTIWPAGYINADVCYLAGNAIASVATEDGTSNIKFTISYDGGTTWSTPVAVGTLTSGEMAHIRQVNFSSRLIVTNGIDSMWYSDTSGRTWTAL